MYRIIAENLKFSDSRGTRLEVSQCRMGGSEAGVICGPRGAGKTLLMRLLAGLLKAQQGSIGPDPLLATKPRLAHPTFYVPAPASQSWLGSSILEEFNLLAGFRSISNFLAQKNPERREWLGAYLSSWGLDCGISCDPSLLSSGEQCLLSLALAEFSASPIILIDSLTGWLDLSGTQLLLHMLERMKLQDRAVYLASNDYERFLRHMDRMILMKEGRIIIDALPERVLPYLEAHGLRKPGAKLAEMTWLDSKK